MRSARLQFEPLEEGRLGALADAILDPEVFQFIEPAVPGRQHFLESQRVAIERRRDRTDGIDWLSYVIVDSAGGQVIGKLEATLHHSLGETAILLDPRRWGRGFATEAMQWLHAHVETTHACTRFAATTHRLNERCSRLLLRTGYVEGEPLRDLLTYEKGDRCFYRPAASH